MALMRPSAEANCSITCEMYVGNRSPKDFQDFQGFRRPCCPTQPSNASSTRGDKTRTRKSRLSPRHEGGPDMNAGLYITTRI